MNGSYFIGVISGTSMDALDAVLIKIKNEQIEIVGHCDHPYSNELHGSLRELSQPGDNEIERLISLDQKVATLTNECVERLLIKTGLRAEDITAIGSHGQTVRHLPEEPFKSTLQIGNPNLIAELSGITTVSDFRRADMASGGQGAPLVPAFHQAIFGSTTTNRAVINIGGISNLTVLPKDPELDVYGYDIGPGNTLMDLWCRKHKGQPYDDQGQWAKSGSLIPALLTKFMEDPYINKPFPKSTGIEYYNENWLFEMLNGKDYQQEDVQRTLTEYTAVTICQAINYDSSSGINEAYICGGGAKNKFLFDRLRELLPDCHVMTTDTLGIDPQHVEASAFAWLAYRSINNLHGNLPAVTGAKREKILGGIYPA